MKKFISKLLLAAMVVTVIAPGNITTANAATNDESNPNTIYYDQDEEIANDNLLVNQYLNRRRDDSYVFEEVSSKTLASNVLVSANASKLIPKNSSCNDSINASISAGKKVGDYTIQAGLSCSVSTNFQGPSSNDALAKNPSNGYLTHNVAVAYVKGDIIQHTFKVYTKYNHTYVRTETVNSIIKRESSYYVVGAQSASTFKVENTSGNKYKTFNNFSDYITNVQNLKSIVLW
jgi:hypothetical protein